MTLSDYIGILKVKKSNKLDLSSNLYNFPGGPLGAKLTGQVVYMLDSRPVNPAALTAVFYEIVINGAAAPELQRVSWPPQNISYDYPDTENVFLLGHQASAPWRINPGAPSAGLVVSPHVVGSVTETRFSRPTSSDPWTVDHVNAVDFSALFTILINGGGHPTSGGRGSNSPEKKITLYTRLEGSKPSGFVWDEILGSPIFPADHGHYVTDESDIPYPWDSAWPDVSSVFTEYYNIWMAVLSDPLQPIYYDNTGSFCDLKMEWVY